MLPQSYPNYKTVHRRFQTWCSNEVLRRVLTDVANELRDKGALDEDECFIDATFVMATLLCVDPMAAPHSRPLGIPHPELPWIRPARLPCSPLQTILR
jgi:hypothetical protein